MIDRLTLEYGSEGPTLAREIRIGARGSLVRAIGRLRNEPGSPPNAATIWGQCLGEHERAEGTDTLPIEAAADAALRDCAEQEAAARRHAVQTVGEANADAWIRGFRQRFRETFTRGREDRPSRPN